MGADRFSIVSHNTRALETRAEALVELEAHALSLTEVNLSNHNIERFRKREGSYLASCFDCAGFRHCTLGRAPRPSAPGRAAPATTGHYIVKRPYKAVVGL